MCLDFIDKEKQCSEAVGYKVVTRGYPLHQKEYLSMWRKHSYLPGHTYNADSSARIKPDPYMKDYYSSGFHIYLDKLPRWSKSDDFVAVIRVKLTGITTTGRENGIKVAVGNHMTILDELTQEEIDHQLRRK